MAYPVFHFLSLKILSGKGLSENSVRQSFIDNNRGDRGWEMGGGGLAVILLGLEGTGKGNAGTWDLDYYSC